LLEESHGVVRSENTMLAHPGRKPENVTLWPNVLKKSAQFGAGGVASPGSRKP
jgi:hypothetical protein